MRRHLTRDRTTAAFYAASGLAFILYPALRPYGPEAGPEGAADFASTAWLASHALGMAGFTLLAFGLRAAAGSRAAGADRTSSAGSGTAGPGRAAHPVSEGPPRPGRAMEAWSWTAVVLLLPYYGVEAYGLNELGRYAVDTGDPAVLSIADAFRYAPFAMTTFGLGLACLAVVGVQFARALLSSGPLARWGGVLAGSALALYLPQFFAPAGLRIAHGAVLCAGLLLAAVAAWRAGAPRAGAPRNEPPQDGTARNRTPQSGPGTGYLPRSFASKRSSASSPAATPPGTRR
ncbi:hypothetical protein ACQ7DA_06505 [Zafaria sp. J156]|uniref:hypothetical protein n=1 Tax=Zafaria sp. J156 TaxID=3116490 RepID=UPI002E78C5D5|nr:hypothetical protein [Zafaria sp. J156]MEE1620977.1 hypothetical protein [Zafaria sp. J156]